MSDTLRDARMTIISTPEGHREIADAIRARLGRPPLPPGQRKSARLEMRTTDARLAKLHRLADAAGCSANAWLERAVDKAR